MLHVQQSLYHYSPITRVSDIRRSLSPLLWIMSLPYKMKLKRFSKNKKQERNRLAR